MSKPKSNKMGVVQLTILTMVNMMGSGIIMLPTKLSEVGTISIISWLGTGRADAAPDRSGDYRRIVGLYHRKLWRRAYYRTDQ